MVSLEEVSFIRVKGPAINTLSDIAVVSVNCVVISAGAVFQSIILVST